MNEHKREVKVAGIQMKCRKDDKPHNLQKALRYIDQAAEDGAKIICLQESFNTEWECYIPRGRTRKGGFPETFKHAETIPGPTINTIIEKAREHGIYIISPILEEPVPGIYYNTAPLIDPRGEILGKYRKIHVCGAEKPFFTPGSEINVFKTDYGNIGIMICFDRNYPEIWRILALKGAEIIFVPYATWWHSKYECINIVSSYHNSVYGVHVNRVGKEDETPELDFFGRSMIVNPYGDVITEASNEKDDIVSATIDLEEVKLARIRNPFLKERRPKLYGRILEPPFTETI